MTIELLISREDYADRAVNLVRRISHSMLESLEFELMNPELDETSPGREVVLIEDGEPVFEGVIYQREMRREKELSRARFLAYSRLINYERHVVFRLYRAGTHAGEIIRDLAMLEEGVDLSEVLDGEQLVSDWPVENASALEVMRDTARGINYLLMMRPGGRLVFRPKTMSTPLGTISEDQVVAAELVEDKWRMRNRVIYIGSGGEVLAEVSEEPGDMPLIIHDPFLTSSAEAERRARTRLMMEKERGVSLRLEILSETCREMGIDIGETLLIDLPSLGTRSKEMIVLGLEYQPSVMEKKRTIILGGAREYFEEFLDELTRGEAASRFGHRLSVAETLSNVSLLVSSIVMTQKMQADARTLRIINKPPLLLENPINVVLDENGEACLAAGFTSGRFDFIFRPESPLFTRWLRTHYNCREMDGYVSVDLLRGDGTIIERDIPPDYEFKYLPPTPGELTHDAEKWRAENAVITSSELSIVSDRSIKTTRLETGTMRLVYPSIGYLGWSLRGMRFLRLYLYSAIDGNVMVRLQQSANEYCSANLSVYAGLWTRNEVDLSSVIGDLQVLNWLELETSLPVLSIDSDYLLIPAMNERIIMRFMLSRQRPTDESPRVALAKIVWREG